MFVVSNVPKNTDTQQLTQQAAERPTARLATASTRKRSLRIADSTVVIGLIASYATSGGAVGIHATVSLAFTAAVGWHFWLHRTWFKSVAKRLSKKRSRKSRRSAFITVLIAIETAGNRLLKDRRVVCDPADAFANETLEFAARDEIATDVVQPDGLAHLLEREDLIHASCSFLDTWQDRFDVSAT
jgi:hypothetical protein